MSEDRRKKVSEMSVVLLSVGGLPCIALAVVFSLRGRRIPSAARNGDS